MLLSAQVLLNQDHFENCPHIIVIKGKKILDINGS